jgi:hypothetical protein
MIRERERVEGELGGESGCCDEWRGEKSLGTGSYMIGGGGGDGTVW